MSGAAKYSPGAEGLLAPLSPWLNDRAVSEILVNQPGEIWVEHHGELTRHELPALTSAHLKRLCQLIANDNEQRLTEENPLLSGSLPDGSRVQLCLPPTAADYTMSIRRKVVRHLTLNDYQQQQFFTDAKPAVMQGNLRDQLSERDKYLLDLYQRGEWRVFISEAVAFKKNIVISGGTSSGKTTFLNACLQDIPLDERLIILEDTREIEAPHPNQVQLLASKGGQAKASIDMQDLVQCSLRLRPDRIIMGEIRGAEVLDFVSACSTGHEGSLTSIHANNPRLAFMRMTQLYKLNNVPSMTDADILRELQAVIDVVIHINKTPQGRRVHSVYFKVAEEVMN